MSENPPAVIDLDEDPENADWVKQTKDVLLNVPKPAPPPEPPK